MLFRDNKSKNKHNKTVNEANNEAKNNDLSYSGIVQNAQENQIISGYFINEKNYKELVISRVNNCLYGVLIFLISFCLICYYFVSCKEVQLNKISRETLELNYENDELQNKVDSLQSYHNIDKAVSKANILERAKQVLEIDAIDLSEYKINKKDRSKKRVLVAY